MYFLYRLACCATNCSLCFQCFRRLHSITPSSEIHGWKERTNMKDPSLQKFTEKCPTPSCCPNFTRKWGLIRRTNALFPPFAKKLQLKNETTYLWDVFKYCGIVNEHHRQSREVRKYVHIRVLGNMALAGLAYIPQVVRHRKAINNKISWASHTFKTAPI